MRMPSSAFPSFGASPSEARLVHRLVRQAAKPAGFETFEIEFGEDSTGDPAVWIWFTISENFPTSKQGIGRLGELARAVKQKILASRINRLAYVRFRSESGLKRA